MDRNHHTPYQEDNVAYSPPEEQLLTARQDLQHGVAVPLSHVPGSGSARPYTSPFQHQQTSTHQDPYDSYKPETTGSDDPIMQRSRLMLDKKWQRRLYWIVPLGVLVIALVVLFEVYKSDFERWVKPLADWLRERKAWSWVLPVIILFLLSFPPLFGHEIVQLIVGLTYPLGVALGIACAGAILGEAGCFVVFKYGFTRWVDRKIEEKVKWAATARIAKEAGFRGVLVIRYSIVPPHLANPLFSCTGMKFWVYMTTVILSLPKSIIFVALGTPSSETSKGVKYAKVAAICVVVAISIWASIWIRKRMKIAVKEIEAERNISSGGLEMFNLHEQDEHGNNGDTVDISYRGSAAV